MSFANNTENNILALIFLATAWANVADNAASSPLTNIHAALATADPGDTGTMSTNESAYTNYARVNVPRSTSGFTTPSGGSTAFAANVDFASSGASGTTITHAQLGKTGGGAVDVFVNGAVSPSIAIGAAGVIPRLTTASTVSVD